MTFSFTPSADSYPGSRQGRKTKVSDITLSASLKDGRGNLCAEQVEKVYESGYSGARTELQVGIKSNCKDPTVTLSLTDQTGKLLDEKTFAIETQSKDKSPEKALIIFGIVILILLILYIVVSVAGKKKKDGVNLSSFIFLFIFSTIFISGILISTPKAEADETTMELPTDLFDIGGGGGGGGGTTPVSTSTVVGLNSSTYGPGDQMTVTSTFTYDACSNASANVIIKGYIEGFPEKEVALFNSIILGGNSDAQYNNQLNAPEQLGDHKLVGTINIYPVLYSASVGLTPLITNRGFIALKEELITYIKNHYSYPEAQLRESFSEITTLTALREVILNTYYITSSDNPTSDIRITESIGTDPTTNTFEVPFKVVASTAPTVNVTIMNDSGVYVHETVTKSVGNDVNIKWETTNTTKDCTCECLNPDNETKELINCGNNPGATSSCGTGFGTVQKTIRNVVRNIKFEVTCNP